MCKIVSPNRTPGQLLYQSVQYFYQAQVSLSPVYGPIYGLWFETVLMWLWLSPQKSVQKSFIDQCAR